MSCRTETLLGVRTTPDDLCEKCTGRAAGKNLTLAVPRILESSRLLRAPEPTLGKLAVNATILPPIGDYTQLKFSVSEREGVRQSPPLV